MLREHSAGIMIYWRGLEVRCVFGNGTESGDSTHSLSQENKRLVDIEGSIYTIRGFFTERRQILADWGRAILLKSRPMS